MLSVSEMTIEELIAEARTLERISDECALESPAMTLRALLGGQYRIREHLKVISDAMVRLREQHEECLSGKNNSYQKDIKAPRLLIEVPPQTGKTLTAVIGGSYWWLARNPQARIVIGSYGNSLAVDRGRDIKRLIDNHGHRHDISIMRGSASVQDWRLTTGGGIRSVGVGAGITGHPADLVIIDDPHKSRAEVNQLGMRDKIWNWFSADITSRLAPDAPIIVIMTPWHIDDLAGRLLSEQGRLSEGGMWDVIRMPAFCDDPKTDPLRRQAGAPLPHPRIPSGDIDALMRHWNLKRSTSTVQDWASLYMCDPAPITGALLDRKILSERRCYQTGSPCHPCDTKRIRSAVAVDPSGGGRDAAGIIAGYLGSDRRLYITHDATGVMDSVAWSRRVCEIAAEIDADQIIFESNFGGDLSKLAIRTAWSALGMSGMCPRIVSVRARKSKLLRAEPIAQQWIEDKIRTATYLPELESEWMTWQPDDPISPGRIDASVYLAYALLPLPSAVRGGGVAVRPRGSLPSSSLGPLG